MLAHHPFHKRKQGRRILCFHDIQDQALFEERIVWLKKHFRFSTLETLLATNSESSLALTFDDAYESWINNVLPVLEKHEIPATFFINSGLIGLSGSAQEQFFLEKCKRSPKGVNALSEAGFQKIAQHPLFEIGGHTKDHFLFSNKTNPQTIREQILDDKKILETKSGKNLKYFAYPFGQLIHAPKKVQAVVESAGYEYAFTIVPGFIQEINKPYLLPRDSLELFQSKKVWKYWLEGAYDQLVYQKNKWYHFFKIQYR